MVSLGHIAVALLELVYADWIHKRGGTRVSCLYVRMCTCVCMCKSTPVSRLVMIVIGIVVVVVFVVIVVVVVMNDISRWINVQYVAS